MEISNLVAADRALGKHLSQCQWNSRLIGLQEFNDREPGEKIYRGDNENPDLFLQQLAESVPDQIQLPLISYFRGIGFCIDIEDVQTLQVPLSNVEGTRHYEVEYANYAFTWTICIIGHGAASIHEIGLPLHRYLYQNPIFNIPYRLFHDKQEGRAVVFRLPATVIEPITIPFVDATPQKSTLKQIYAAIASYKIKVPMIWMEQVTPVVEEIELMPIISRS